MPLQFAPMVTSIDGYRYPIELIGRLARPKGCLFIVDAAQALGQIPIDVNQLGCDVLVATCLKWLRGPRNTAIFLLNRSIEHQIAVQDIEQVDFSLGARLGLGVAVSEVQKTGIYEIEKHILGLKQHAAHTAYNLGLAEQTNTPSQTGTLCLGIPISAAAFIQQQLASQGFIVKFPNRKFQNPFAVIEETGTVPLRFSANIYNTADEVSYFFNTLKEILNSSQAQ